MFKFILTLIAFFIFTINAYGKYCSLCYVVSEIDGMKLNYQIMSVDLLEFNLPLNQSAEAMFDACVAKRKEKMKKHPALKKIGMFVTKKYVDYKPRSANTFIGITNIHQFKKNAPQDEKDINCDLVKASEYSVKLNYDTPMSAKDMQQQQDEAHGYAPKPSTTTPNNSIPGTN